MKHRANDRAYTRRQIWEMIGILPPVGAISVTINGDKTYRIVD
jgi:hypothetical protein